MTLSAVATCLLFPVAVRIAATCLFTTSGFSQGPRFPPSVLESGKINSKCGPRGAGLSVAGLQRGLSGPGGAIGRIVLG